MEQKRTPLIPLTEEELDIADAAHTGRPSFADQGWTKEDYLAVGAAIDEQRWEQPKKQSDPEMLRLNNRLDRNSKVADATNNAQHSGDQAESREAILENGSPEIYRLEARLAEYSALLDAKTQALAQMDAIETRIKNVIDFL
jgi:hypothetical protein